MELEFNTVYISVFALSGDSACCGIGSADCQGNPRCPCEPDNWTGWLSHEGCVILSSVFAVGSAEADLLTVETGGLLRM